MPYIGDYISLQTGGQWCRGGVGDYISQQTDGHWIINDYSDINYTGSINAIIDTYSKIYFKQPILISGHIAAEIDLISKVNAGKIKAINPMLIAQNSSYNFGDCPIAVIEYEGFSPDNIINIISTEDNIYENSVDFHIIETANKEGSYFPINYYHYSEKASGLIDYLVTNYRSQNDAGTPLFYQYELLFDAVSDDSKNLIIQVYKNNNEKLDKTDYKLQYSDYDNLLKDGNSRYSTTTWSSKKDSTKRYHRIRLLLPYEAIDNSTYYIVEYTKILKGVSMITRELVELIPIYDSSDYIFDSNGFKLTSSSKIPSNTQSLSVVKNPIKRIVPLGISVSKSYEGTFDYVTDKTSSWNIKIQDGTILIESGIYGNSEDKFYKIDSYYSDPVPITNIRPEIISENIIKVKEFPIYLNTEPGYYSYPTYNIPIYDKDTPFLTDLAGKISIDVNGITRTDINILSIDRYKGYIQLDKPLRTTDELELTFWLDTTSISLLDNLELNPKIALPSESTGQHISGYMDGIGIAIREYDSSDIQTTYPYIYPLASGESSRICYSIPPISGDSTSVTWDDTFISICELGLNKLSVDMLKYTDARVIGGGIKYGSLLNNWMRTYGSGHFRELDWYTDKGYMDGEPFPNNSLLIIHIPEDTLSGQLQNWIDYYSDNMNNQDEAIYKARKEHNYWLDKTIRRYISAGTDYILVPTISGDFNSENIMSEVNVW